MNKSENRKPVLKDGELEYILGFQCVIGMIGILLLVILNPDLIFLMLLCLPLAIGTGILFASSSSKSGKENWFLNFGDTK